jgi:hypothetical protein
LKRALAGLISLSGGSNILFAIDFDIKFCKSGIVEFGDRCQ